MFTGKPTAVITALAICMQLTSSLFLAIIVPARESSARALQAPPLLEASDTPMAHDASPAEGAPPAQDEACDRDAELGAGAVSVEQSESAAATFGAQPSGNDDAHGAFPSQAGQGTHDADELRVLGVIDDGGYRYTWYSQNVLPGGGLEIEGRHVSDEGYVVDAQERIVVASSELPFGTELDIPFGSGKAVVLDCGCPPNTIDIYTAF